MQRKYNEFKCLNLGGNINACKFLCCPQCHRRQIVGIVNRQYTGKRQRAQASKYGSQQIADIFTCWRHISDDSTPNILLPCLNESCRRNPSSTTHTIPEKFLQIHSNREMKSPEGAETIKIPKHTMIA